MITNRPAGMNRFAVYAWGVLGWNLLVVLWGAFVRASGSGAGCGSHWPLCNGEVVPRAPRLETMIELTHRLTSGVALLLVVGLLLWAWRAFPRGHIVRRGALAAMGLMLLEALLGAGLVLFELVADNASGARALAIAAHLVNTFLLLGAIALTAWWGSGGSAPRLRGQGRRLWMLGGAIAGLLLLGASGAVTALGDTLFPASSLAQGMRQDLSPTAHLLVRLRVFHPLLAMGIGLYVVLIAGAIARERSSLATRRLARLLTGLFLIQIAAGFLNLALLVPVWMQLVHLLLADAVWLSLVLFSASALGAAARKSHDLSGPSETVLEAPLPATGCS